MKKRLLPVPLILLIPIVLLIIVTVAGIYRFSLSDEDILAKFPSQAAKNDPIMQSVFAINTFNPWTIKIPESSAFTFIDDMTQPPRATGSYEDGAERGTVTIDTDKLIQLDEFRYLSPLVLSNQGSGVFHYLIVSEYDQFRQRMVSQHAALLGDRVIVKQVRVEDGIVRVTLLEREPNQPMVQEPSQMTTILFQVTEQGSLKRK